MIVYNKNDYPITPTIKHHSKDRRPLTKSNIVFLKSLGFRV